MKKLNLLFIALVLSFSSTFANTINLSQAAQVAQNFYKETTGQTVVMTLAYECDNTDARNGVAIGVPIYYVFNAPANGGFVMVSGDDLAKPIMGYNTTGQFVIQNAPPVVADWFGKYSRQIAYAKVNASATSPEITTMWTHYSGSSAHITKQLRTGAVGPLVTTTWDQPYPYNAMCPQDASAPSENDGRVLTGCGATAMSQIMRYWSYPAQGTGSNSYSSNYGTLSVDFGTTTYNWANMPTSVSTVNTDVATIMYDCGVAVDMMYGPNESSSYILPGTGVPASCEAAYTAYFGYDANLIQGLQRANYPVESNWTALIDGEMAASRPIQYAGSGSDGGHTFVLDGSDGAGNYHINWGWSGIDNGYYSVDALIPAPYSNGSFDNGEEMVIGIQPPNTTVSNATIDLYTAITVTPDPISFLTTFSVNCSLINNGTSNFNGYYCAAMFDASGTFIRFIGDILGTNGSPLQAGYYYSSPGLTFNDTTTFVTVPGTYTIGIYYQATGANTWTLAGESTFTNPISVTVAGANDPGITLYSNIAPLPTTFEEGQAASVQVNLLNDGSATYVGEFEAVLLDLQGNYVETIGTYNESGLQVNYYDSLLFSTGDITAAEGQYILAIAEEAQGTSDWYYCGGQTYANPVLINVVNNEINILAINEVAADKIKVYPNPATDRLTIDAGTVEGAYTLNIFNTVGQQVSESSGLLNGQAFSTDVSGLAPGVYSLQLKTSAGALTSHFVVK